MKTLIFVVAVLLAFSSCTKSVVVPDNSSYNGYYSDPYYNPYYDPNYDPYSDPYYYPYSANSLKPGSQTVTSGEGAAIYPGGRTGASSH